MHEVVDCTLTAPRVGNREENVKNICVLALPRSGTSYLVEVWRDFANHASFGEMFHNKGANDCEPHLDALNASLGVSANTIHDPYLIKAMAENPEKAVTSISASLKRAGYTSLSWKVFPSHMERRTLRRFLKERNAVPVFVKRKPIDSYISSQKATLLQNWGHADTTEVQVELDYDDFCRWHRAKGSWMSAMRKHLDHNEIPYGTLTYEHDIDQPIDQTLLNSQKALASLGVHLQIAPNRKIARRVKQDRSASQSKKVSNWEAFENKARADDALWMLSEYF